VALTSQPDPLDLVSCWSPLFGAVHRAWWGGVGSHALPIPVLRNVWQPIAAVIPAAAARRGIIRQASSWLTGLLEIR